MIGWHWVSDDRTLRDGRPLPAVGEVLRHEGPVRMCESGLHASWTPLQGLPYAPGSWLTRVDCREIVDREPGDKFVCRERIIVWQADCTDLLRRFARRCALDVIHLWDAPEVVVRYLRTGDESLRGSAWASARASAPASAWASARASASESAWASASESAWASSWATQSRRLSAMIARLRGEE